MNLNQHTSIIPGVQEGAAVRLPHPIQSIEYLNYDLVVTEKQDPTTRWKRARWCIAPFP